MKDYTHAIAVKAVQLLGKGKCYTEEEATIITYGTELFLNSSLKAIIYLLAGVLCGKLQEVVITIIVFGCLRIFAGGVHAKTDTGCFAMTGLIIMLAVVSPLLIILTMEEYGIIAMIINLLYIGFAPRDEYYESHKNKKIIQKIKIIVLVNIILLLSCNFDNYWRTIVTVIILEEGLTLLPVDIIRKERKK